MGICKTTISTAAVWVGCLMLLTGCQPPQAEMSERLTAHLALVDFSGLGRTRSIHGVSASASIPRSWELLPTQDRGIVQHCQWRSPSRGTAVGIVHVRMPLPMSAKMLVWLAEAKYNDAKPADDGRKVPGGPGRVVREWSDPVGREWIEAENDRYRVRGYAVTCGFDAWLVYTGYKLKGIPNTVDIELASRSLESVVPDALASGSH